MILYGTTLGTLFLFSLQTILFEEIVVVDAEKITPGWTSSRSKFPVGANWSIEKRVPSFNLNAAGDGL
jgi:hypothetical protein